MPDKNKTRKNRKAPQGQEHVLTVNNYNYNNYINFSLK